MSTASGTDRLPRSSDTFPVTHFQAERPQCIVLFAVGRGGNPGRHQPLLEALAQRNCTVIAPHFDMLVPRMPTKTDLDIRIRRLEACLDSCADSNLPIVGLGHSIGAAMLLALQGAEGLTFHGERLVTGSRQCLQRLALLAPPTDFFRLPGALKSIRIPLKIWIGGEDTITPPAQARFLHDALTGQVPVSMQIDPEAGHFTYMNDLPPNVQDSHADRGGFLASLADEIHSYLTSKAI